MQKLKLILIYFLLISINLKKLLILHNVSSYIIFIKTFLFITFFSLKDILFYLDKADTFNKKKIKIRVYKE